MHHNKPPKDRKPRSKVNYGPGTYRESKFQQFMNRCFGGTCKPPRTTLRGERTDRYSSGRGRQKVNRNINVFEKPSEETMRFINLQENKGKSAYKLLQEKKKQKEKNKISFNTKIGMDLSGIGVIANIKGGVGGEEEVKVPYRRNQTPSTGDEQAGGTFKFYKK